MRALTREPPTTAVVARSDSGTTLFASKSQFERYIDKVFANADSNKDGKVNFSEVYELVLKIYVKLNRQAPVPPPSREMVMLFYEKSDKNNDKYLTRDEFEVLVKAVSKRAFVRVVSFKLVKILGAPLVAEYLVRTLSGKEWLSKLASTLVPVRFQKKVLPVITSRVFCRNVLLVLLFCLGHCRHDFSNAISCGRQRK